MSTVGYGICIDHAKWKSNASEIFFHKFVKKAPDILEQYQEYRENYLEECQDEQESPRESEIINAFCDDYENETQCWGYIEGLIVDTINDLEFSGDVIFRYDDYCIYVAPRIPLDDEERKNMLTQKNIQELFSKYMNDLLEEPLNVEWQDICY